MARPRARRLADLALAATSLLVTALIGECSLRLVWPGIGHPRRPPMRASHLEGLPVLEGMIALMRPNVRGVSSGVLFETNEFGFRGPDRTLVAAPGTFRVALIGDSIAMGAGVEYEATYGSLLEKRLNSERLDATYEVLNFAVAGLNTRIILYRLKRLGLRFAPDLIVYGYTLNDIADRHYIHSYVDHGNYERYARSPIRIVQVLGPHWRMFVEAVFAPQGSYVNELHENYFHNEAAWADLLAGFDDLARTGRESAACVVLFIHASLQTLNVLHPFQKEYDVVAEAAKQRGLFVVESFDGLRGRNAPDLWVASDDAHPNEQGHRILAELLGSGLERLPANCWRPHGAR